MASIKVAFWNLENLFDTTVSEIAADLKFTPENGWDDAAFKAKLTNLAQIIKLMHDGQGPDLLGLCEIENASVAQQLIAEIGRPDLELAHIESPDIRGIDCSLIFSREVFELAGDPVGHLVHLRFPTRDIFEVPLRVLDNGAELTVLVNHWPSRSRGRVESEAFRVSVASHCGRITDGMLKFSRGEYGAMPDTQATLDTVNQRWNRNLLLMGDFNDEPFNRSVLEELKASNGVDKLEELIKKSTRRKTPTMASYLKRQAYLFNCMWPILGRQDEGTFYFSRSTNTMNVLDQFILSRGLFFGEQHLGMDLDSVQVFTPDLMTTPSGRPRAFSKKTHKGFSDHFPIEAVIETR